MTAPSRAPGPGSSNTRVAPPKRPVTRTPQYWNDIAGRWRRQGDERAWRMVSDAVNRRLMERWLVATPRGSVLKTDLFDEVVGKGLVPWLEASFARVVGVDISPDLVEMARARRPGLEAEPADVRALPFPTGTFDAVVSNSTLDHFTSSADIGVAIGELHRVLRTGGTLLVTLDNPVNPVIAMRNALPEWVRTASRMVPFAVGATLGPRRLRALLERTGFVVERTGAVFHCPRVLVVLGGHFVDRPAGAAAKRRFVRVATAFDVLAALPTRYLTGYFVAALARKR